MKVTHDPETAENVETVLQQVAENLTCSLSLDPLMSGPPERFRVAALNVLAAACLELIDWGDESESETLAHLGIDRAEPRPLRAGWSDPCPHVCPTQALLLATLSSRNVVNKVREDDSSADLRSSVLTALTLIAERLDVVPPRLSEHDYEGDGDHDLNQAYRAFILLIGREPELDEDIQLISDLIPLRHEVIQRPSVIHDSENGLVYFRVGDPEATKALSRALKIGYDRRLEEDQIDDEWDDPYQDDLW